MIILGGEEKTIRIEYLLGMPDLDASQVDGDTYVLNEQTDKDSAMCKF